MPNTYSASGLYLLFLENNSQSIFLCILICYLIHIVFKSDQFFFFWRSSEPHACKAGILPLELLCQTFPFLSFFLLVSPFSPLGDFLLLKKITLGHHSVFSQGKLSL
jgi:hypothetical protein